MTDCLFIYSLYFFSVSQFYTCKPVAINMGVRSLRERGGRNFIQGDLTSRKIMDSMSGGVLSAFSRFNERGGGGAVRLQPIERAGGGGGGGGGGVLSVKTGDLI